ncbi:RpiR family transcriptional regulator, partial [Enterococcus entomosocium]
MLLGDKLRLQEGLTNTEKRIADYILQNINDVPSLTIEVIAKHTYT